MVRKWSPVQVRSWALRRGVKMRVRFELECLSCKRRNYSTVKNKKTTTERLEIKKYCPFERKHTIHKEVKK